MLFEFLVCSFSPELMELKCVHMTSRGYSPCQGVCKGTAAGAAFKHCMFKTQYMATGSKSTFVHLKLVVKHCMHQLQYSNEPSQLCIHEADVVLAKCAA